MNRSRRQVLALFAGAAAGLAAGVRAARADALAERYSADEIVAQARAMPLGEIVHHGDAPPHRVRVSMPADAFPIVSDYHSKYGINGDPRAQHEVGIGYLGSANPLHRGIDIAAPRGCPVIAVADGVVKRSERPLGGNVVVMEHDFPAKRLTYRSLYGHLDEVFVADGEAVERGRIIGAVGNSGRGGTDTTHLHFEAGNCCQLVNPHTRWYAGVGKVTLLRPGRAYAERPDRFVYPLPGVDDLAWFMSQPL